MTIIYIILGLLCLLLLLWKVKIPYSIARNININASQDDVFSKVTNLSTWDEWSPWIHAETDCPTTVTGTGTQEGDVYSWDGKLVGSGELEHIKLQSPTKLQQEIRFLKPWQDTANITWNITENGDETKAEWRFNGKMPLGMFWMLPMMSAWIGYDYDRGLKMLKSKLETGVIHSKTVDNNIVDSPEIHYLGIKNSCSVAEIGPSMSQDFNNLQDAIIESGITPTGRPFSLYHKWDMKTGATVYTACIPVPPGATLQSNNNIISGVQPATKVLKVSHTGAYHFLANAWSMAMMLQRNGKHKANKAATNYEVYVTDPQETEPKDLVTEIYIPIKG